MSNDDHIIRGLPYVSSLKDILGPIYPRVTIIINMYNMYIYVESISQSHMTLHNRGNIYIPESK